jgi:hypothetical protein
MKARQLDKLIGHQLQVVFPRIKGANSYCLTPVRREQRRVRCLNGEVFTLADFELVTDLGIDKRYRAMLMAASGGAI